MQVPSVPLALYSSLKLEELVKKPKPLDRQRKDEPLPDDEALTWVYVPEE